MIAKFKFHALIVLSFLGCSVAFAAPAPAAAAAFGQGGGAIVTCSSNDGGRKNCGADTRGGVRMTRQISGSACIQGQTWGYDNNGIWVDRGCRAEFAVGRGGGGGWGGGNNWGGGGNQAITCSSDDGRRKFCGANTRGGVSLSRQISGSACIQGQTWGYDNSGIWVDRGCRAEFVTGNGNGNGGGWGGGNGNQTFTCSSNDGRRNYCSVPPGTNPRNVRLTRQISGSACIQGQTWGADRRGVWVDRGCRAEFR